MADQDRARGMSPLPGQLVCHPGQPDWGIGQIQSAIGGRLTVNFVHAGKQVINSQVVNLVPAETVLSRP